MSAALRLFSSESVTEGHPDKLCDQVSDRILDAYLAADPNSRVAVETLVTTGLVQIAGEVRSSVLIPVAEIARQAIRDAGYTHSELGFDGDTCAVNVAIGAQSPDIAQGVDVALEAREGDDDELNAQGAGDQGIMFGYATDETPDLLPLPISLAHRLSRRLATVRKSGDLDYLRPDGKTQVTIGYEGATPRTVETVVISAQHAPSVSLAQLQADLIEVVAKPVLDEADIDASGVRFLINPTGRFELGGPKGDAGLTGRKIIVDTYGGAARHGGGAFSGKDPSKVDRSAAYALRWAAKNVVAAGLAKRIELQLAYAIGAAAPVGLYVETFGTGTVADEAIVQAVRDVFDFRPAAIVRDLDLLRPIYAPSAAYGHFGRSTEGGFFPWEQLNRVDALRAAAGIAG